MVAGRPARCYGLGGDPRQVPRHRLARNDWHD